MREHDADLIDTRDVRNIRKSMYDARRKTNPSVAKDFEQALDQMELLFEKKVTSKKEKFVHVVDGLICFTTASNLK